MNRILKLIGPLLLAMVLGSQAWAQPAVPHVAKSPFPQLTLPDRASGGQRAVDLLGSRLPEVAAWYGKSTDEFRAMLLKDRTLRLDRRGRLFVVDELDQPLPATPAPAASTGALDGTFAPLDQTFLLHSRPGAQRTIYLNFQGATLTNTAWNGSSGSIAALPFDLDGIPYSFSSAELQRIQAIWQRVAEDYAAFDVNVTTEAVPLDQITRGGSADGVFGTTVLITKRTGVYNCSCGGVAYLGIFSDTSDYYKPALVFYDALGSGNEKYVAEAISHEAGHNMGLGHDGYSSGGYYPGHGSGATAWAPIMGVGYYQSLVQWSKGEYASANNVQDDYAVMQSNGLPLRADDHGNTPATATVLDVDSRDGLAELSATGVIERPTDIDTFAFVAGAGTATFSIFPAARSANLDALVTLRDAAGKLLASVNPADALNAGFNVTLPAAGTYYLSIRGTGKGDPLATGYTAYGSVGQYGVSASLPATDSQAPVAAITASTLRGTAPLTVAFSGAGSSDADGRIVAHAWTFGDTTTGSNVDETHVYATPGSYPVQLRVTDDSGLSATSSVTVTVDPPVTTSTMRVADIAMSLKNNKNGSAQASADVRLLDTDGRAVVGASVTGSWSGLVSRNSSATTDATGTARFKSPSTRSKSGTFVFTVKGATLNGYVYAPATNTETSDSISR
ncbi:MAG: PKD domain-containing protein [Rubrivivax sp.]|nr:PKD domain-containing protein [Rubrivivax sp.]